jgi:hypothetical protein
MKTQTQKGPDEKIAEGVWSRVMDEVKSRNGFLQDEGEDGGKGNKIIPTGMNETEKEEEKEETLLRLRSSLSQSKLTESTFSHHRRRRNSCSSHSTNNGSSGNSTVNGVKDVECEEVLLRDTEEDSDKDISKPIVPALPLLQKLSIQTSTGSNAEPDSPIPREDPQYQEKVHEEAFEKPNPSANASLSIHAFSLDTTWPVPRILAQTFWFPFAHGIIYIVDATRKNDPRGMDHLLNARQFLASLVADPHFCRRDIPIVVFANKAGSDPETCYRLDEIAEILGCEEWDVSGAVEKRQGDQVQQQQGTRPWCVKSTRADGQGDGIRESVEWLKSRMGEIWKS